MKVILVLLIITHVQQINTGHDDFDWNYYNQINTSVVNSNFDWEYYIHVNNLNHINNEQEALNHYHTRGSVKGLPYCKKFSIGILLHLYNLNLMDEFIEKINYFMSINNLNNYFIKINIPIDKNIGEFNHSLNIGFHGRVSDTVMLNQVLRAAPYHKYLITKQNFRKLYSITQYLKNKLAINPEKIQIIFSENRGLDIGSFFLFMDQIFKQNLVLDYVIKLHTKSDSNWRERLTCFLNLRINKLLRSTEYVYTVCAPFDWKKPDGTVSHLATLVNYFNIPKKSFIFCGGTMFIVSYRMVNFFKSYNLLGLFNSLNKLNFSPIDGYIEHAYERFFGTLGQHLNLKLYVPTYIKRSADERLSTPLLPVTI